MLLLCRTYTFCAAHRLFNPAFSDEENWAVFDKCNNPNFHGHNYVLEVHITGNVDNDTQMLLNLVSLDELVHAAIIDRVDHKNLNLDVPMFAGLIPSAEVMAAVFYQQLAAVLPAEVRLHAVKLQESPNNGVSYYGPAGQQAA
jgi:6-pyruvoyltetrahydropterin/6-carboxytetrahydropterin synthase